MAGSSTSDSCSCAGFVLVDWATGRGSTEGRGTIPFRGERPLVSADALSRRSGAGPSPANTSRCKVRVSAFIGEGVNHTVTVKCFVEGCRELIPGDHDGSAGG